MIKSTKFAKMLVIMCVVFLGSVNVALAVPTLQLYIPSADYNEDTESWLTYDNPFQLQVLGATQPNGVTVIENVKLHFAVPEEYFVLGGSIHIIGEEIDKTIGYDDMILSYGHPADLSQPHGIYDTYYYSVELPDLAVGTAGDTVYNYNPGESGSDTGAIQYYEVSYENYFLIHMDLTGRAMKYNEKDELLNSWDRFAPFSHDADAVVPEPATMLLVGTGLIGLGWTARRKLKK